MLRWAEQVDLLGMESEALSAKVSAEFRSLHEAVAAVRSDVNRLQSRIEAERTRTVESYEAVMAMVQELQEEMREMRESKGKG
ncbi:protein of unknown function DUF3135 [Kipferlia bialata]|uniref:Uncharacterized protein n=1 Tax=Kipferlia bialata TaxID=797122 RepID=A0A391NZN4_9EUKA|nr:protein of unknown function DUF3135 [Kipferlia bialata]|eukprot:g366.t1